jgi:glucokinase
VTFLCEFLQYRISTIHNDDKFITCMEVAIGIDIGATKCAAGIVARNGGLIDRDVFRVNHKASAEELFDELAVLVTSQLSKAVDTFDATPVVIGVGSAGPIAPNVEWVSPLNIAAWRKFPLRQRLETLTGLPVYGDGDAKALALAEGWLGAAKGYDTFMAMVVSTGVGGGIVINGRLLDGETGNTGHIGHVVVEPNGRRCACGGRGCLEAEASGPSIEAISGRPVEEATFETMQRAGRLVGRATASVCNLLDMKLVVVGGSVALNFGANFFNAAQKTMDELCGLDFSRNARIVPARLGSEGPIIGASAIGWRGVNRAELHEPVSHL